MKLPIALFASTLLCVSAIPAYAQTAEYTTSIKDHRFVPDVIEIPANTKVKLLVRNEDATPEEFESHALHREKIIKGNSTATILLGPLKAGEYPFVGEFHEETAQGKIIVQ